MTVERFMDLRKELNAESADNSRQFVSQQIAHLLMDRTAEFEGSADDFEVQSEEHFWTNSGDALLKVVILDDFKVIDWFPRTPGMCWSEKSLRQRFHSHAERRTDDILGSYYTPLAKGSLVEACGIGTIRLRPKLIGNEYYWIATALKGHRCEAGIPLAIPDSLLRKSGLGWGGRARIVGSVRFLQDADLSFVASSVFRTRPLILFVDEIQALSRFRDNNDVLISPVVLYGSDPDRPGGRPGYTFTQCLAGDDKELDKAVSWMERYADRYAGRILTNFDEQRPVLADAPLSYQRLVSKHYERDTLEHYAGPIVVERVDTLIRYETVIQGDIRMQNSINVSGNAIINIDTALNNVTQTIGAAVGLDANQKSELDLLVESLKTQLETLKSTHADEVTEIAESLQKVVTAASKAPEERKKRFLDLSAVNLIQAAQLVDKAAPTVVHIATRIAHFLQSLVAS